MSHKCSRRLIKGRIADPCGKKASLFYIGTGVIYARCAEHRAAEHFESTNPPYPSYDAAMAALIKRQL